MPTASYTKCTAAIEPLLEGINVGSDSWKVALTNTDATAKTSFVAGTDDLATGNGYTAGGTAASITSSSQSSGTYKLVLADVTFTASGGSIGPFRYAVLYNDTATNDELIGFWDYGSSISLNNGEALTVDFDATNGVLQLV